MLCPSDHWKMWDLCSQYGMWCVQKLDSHSTYQGFIESVPDSKVHGANMGPFWGRQGPGGPHVGPMNFVIWGVERSLLSIYGIIHHD